MKTWTLECGCRVNESHIIEMCTSCRTEHDELHERAQRDHLERVAAAARETITEELQT